MKIVYNFVMEEKYSSNSMTREDLRSQIRKAIKPGFYAMTMAMDATYGPKALGYTDPNTMGDYDGPQDIRDKVYQRYFWFHNVIKQSSRNLSVLSDPQYESEKWFQRLFQNLSSESPKHQYDFSGLPQEACECLRASALECLQILKKFEQAQNLKPADPL